MRILVVHNRYRQPGGEDVSVEAEARLLEEAGHQVIRYTLDNEAVGEGRASAVAVAVGATWNVRAHRQLRRLVRAEQPQVAHFHNTFPLVSPSGLYAAAGEDVPVVVTVRNYRLLCANALLFRDGRVCEDCVGRGPWRAVAHACYRGSRPASAATAAMLAVHRRASTWTRTVDTFVALSEFARAKLVEGGLPAGRVTVKPNFVHPDPGPGPGGGGYALYAGRLSPEKGIRTLLAAWADPGLAQRLPLRVVGDGPLAAEVAAGPVGVTWLGPASPEEVLDHMGAADVVVFPSEWYETFGRVAAEAYARGTPVVGADIGAVAELVEPGVTGARFRPGDPVALAAAVAEVLGDDRGGRLRAGARRAFEDRFSAARNLEQLEAIYARVTAAGARRG